jgi:ribosomal protein S27AE
MDENDGRFYLFLECENCGEDVFFGPCLTLFQHKGLVAIPIDMGAQERLTCGSCGAVAYTGELEVMTEGGDEPDVELLRADAENAREGELTTMKRPDLEAVARQLDSTYYITTGTRDADLIEFILDNEFPDEGEDD